MNIPRVRGFRIKRDTIRKTQALSVQSIQISCLVVVKQSRMHKLLVQINHEQEEDVMVRAKNNTRVQILVNKFWKKNFFTSKTISFRDETKSLEVVET